MMIPDIRVDQDGGFALPMVLWACVLMELTVSGLLSSQHSLRRQAHETYLASQLGCADDAAIFTALDDMTQPEPHFVRRVDGVPQSLQVLGFNVTLLIQDEAGLVDLNASGREPIRKIFVGTGLDSSVADAFADRILDWRERGLGKRINGAKRDEYNAAGYSYGPPQRPFRSVGELRLVLGMSQQLFEEVSGSFSVSSELQVVDMTVAPPSVFATLLASSDDDLSDMIARRLVASQAGRNFVSGSAIGRAYSVTATIRQGELTVHRHIVARLTGHVTSPLWYYE